MQTGDLPQFTDWLTTLAEYFPANKINLEVVVDGYFDALKPLSLAAVKRLFIQARDDCEYFPTLATLKRMANLRQEALCARCGTDHGIHQGHTIAHYPAGPWCSTCNADIPTPQSYSYQAPPALLVHAQGVKRLSQPRKPSNGHLTQNRVHNILPQVLPPAPEGEDYE